jgi:glycosyltransferase involved in cell wall biosynthesis
MNDIVESGQGSFKNVVCYLVGQDDGSNRMSHVADEVIYLNLDRKKATWSNSGTVQGISDIIDSRKVDIVDCHMWRAMPIGVRAANRAAHRPKVVGVFHGVKERPNLQMKLLYFFAMRGMDKIVSVSEGGLNEITSVFWRVDTRKLVAIPNGLDFADWVTVMAGDRATLFGEQFVNRRVFITVSRLADKKNLERLISAFAEMHKSHADSGLVIVGEGRTRGALETLVEQLGLAESVAFLGYRQDIPELLKTADVYAIPSLREGLPRSLVEAMAVAKPVLASRIHGHSEVVTDFEHGRLVDPFSVSDMTAALTYFMTMDKPALEKMGNAASEHVIEHFNRDVMMTKYRQLFQSLA